MYVVDINVVPTTEGKVTGALSKYFLVLRPQYWWKNIYIFTPAIIVFQNIRFSDWYNLILCSFSWCLLSSLNYIVNTYYDLDSDIHHPLKRHRAQLIKNIGFKNILLLAAFIFALDVLVVVVIHKLWLVFISAIYLLNGYFYNVRPYRLKDRQYIDILSEAINVTLRGLCGALIIDQFQADELIMISICSFCIGLLFALQKRKSDMNSIHHDQVLHYRPVLLQYTQKKIIHLSALSLVFLLAFTSTALFQNYIYKVPITNPDIQALVYQADQFIHGQLGETWPNDNHLIPGATFANFHGKIMSIYTAAPSLVIAAFKSIGCLDLYGPLLSAITSVAIYTVIHFILRNIFLSSLITILIIATPYFQAIGASLYTENPARTLMMISLALFLKSIDVKKSLYLFFSLVVGIMAIHFRPSSGIAFALALTIIIFFSRSTAFALRAIKIKYIALSFIFVLLPLFAWNAAIYDSPFNFGHTKGKPMGRIGFGQRTFELDTIKKDLFDFNLGFALERFTKIDSAGIWSIIVPGWIDSQKVNWLRSFRWISKPYFEVTAPDSRGQPLTRKFIFDDTQNMSLNFEKLENGLHIRAFINEKSEIIGPLSDQINTVQVSLFSGSPFSQLRLDNLVVKNKVFSHLDKDIIITHIADPISDFTNGGTVYLNSEDGNIRQSQLSFQIIVKRNEIKDMTLISAKVTSPTREGNPYMSYVLLALLFCIVSLITLTAIKRSSCPMWASFVSLVFVTMFLNIIIHMFFFYSHQTFGTTALHTRYYNESTILLFMALLSYLTLKIRKTKTLVVLFSVISLMLAHGIYWNINKILPVHSEYLELPAIMNELKLRGEKAVVYNLSSFAIPITDEYPYKVGTTQILPYRINKMDYIRLLRGEEIEPNLKAHYTQYYIFLPEKNAGHGQLIKL